MAISHTDLKIHPFDRKKSFDFRFAYNIKSLNLLRLLSMCEWSIIRGCVRAVIGGCVWSVLSSFVKWSFPITATAPSVVVFVVMVLMLCVLVVDNLSKINVRFSGREFISIDFYLLRGVSSFQIDPKFGDINEQADQCNDKEFHL